MATGSVLASTAGYAYADAGAAGSASDSPGVGSGNAVQVPVDVPVNVCGNTVDVVGLLNPAMGNNCKNGAEHAKGSKGSEGSNGSGGPGGGAASLGGTHDSPGVGSGNAAQAPVSVPLNLCGDSANVVGAGNSAHGNSCANHGGGTGVHTPTPSAPPENCSCTPPPPPPADNCPPPTRDHPQPPPPLTPPAKPPVTTPGHHSSPPPPQTVTKVGRTTHISTSATRGTATTPTQAVLASTGAGDTMLMLPTGAALALGGLLLYRRSRAGQS